MEKILLEQPITISLAIRHIKESRYGIPIQNFPKGHLNKYLPFYIIEHCVNVIERRDEHEEQFLFIPKDHLKIKELIENEPKKRRYNPTEDKRDREVIIKEFQESDWKYNLYKLSFQEPIIKNQYGLELQLDNHHPSWELWERLENWCGVRSNNYENYDLNSALIIMRGKWLIFPSNKKEADELWEIIAKDTEEDNLGISSKISTEVSDLFFKTDYPHKNYGECSIVVYSTSEMSDIRRIENRLREIGIRKRMIYKGNEMEKVGQFWEIKQEKITIISEEIKDNIKYKS